MQSKTKCNIDVYKNIPKKIQRWSKTCKFLSGHGAAQYGICKAILFVLIIKSVDTAAAATRAPTFKIKNKQQISMMYVRWVCSTCFVKKNPVQFCTYFDFESLISL